MSEKIKRCAIYIRVSTSEQMMHGKSLEAQREYLAGYAKDHGMIPVGVYAPGAEGETVSLTFSGTDGFSYATLYDAETRTETPIREGSRFIVPANTAGRYFLRAGVPTANEAVQESAIRIYTVGGGTLVVASTDLLRTVRVYDFAGRLVANETGLRTTQCRIELPQGSYIVKAESERGEEEEKIRM